MRSLWLAMCVSLICVCDATPKIIDLTHALGERSLNWPGTPGFNFTILTREQLKYFWMESNWFATAEHSGTHLDAPAHFIKGGQRVHKIPLEKLIGPGVVIDVTEKAQNNPDYELDVNDLLGWEREYGEIPVGAMVTMNSGWASKWPNRTLVYGTDTPDNLNTFHFPGLNPDAAMWLVKQRNIHVFGTDTPSVDRGQTTKFESHATLYNNNTVGVENVANLHLLPAHGSRIYAMPMKLYNGSGGPVRVFAILEDRMISEYCVDNIVPYALSAFVVLLAVIYVRFSMG